MQLDPPYELPLAEISEIRPASVVHNQGGSINTGSGGLVHRSAAASSPGPVADSVPAASDGKVGPTSATAENKSEVKPTKKTYAWRTSLSFPFDSSRFKIVKFLLRRANIYWTLLATAMVAAAVYVVLSRGEWRLALAVIVLAYFMMLRRIADHDARQQAISMSAFCIFVALCAGIIVHNAIVSARAAYVGFKNPEPGATVDKAWVDKAGLIVRHYTTMHASDGTIAANVRRLEAELRLPVNMQQEALSMQELGESVSHVCLRTTSTERIRVNHSLDVNATRYEVINTVYEFRHMINMLEPERAEVTSEPAYAGGPRRSYGIRMEPRSEASRLCGSMLVRTFPRSVCITVTYRDQHFAWHKDERFCDTDAYNIQHYWDTQSGKWPCK